MRSNSGKDESRNNLKDPTLRERGRSSAEREAPGNTAKAPADNRQGRKD